MSAERRRSSRVEIVKHVAGRGVPVNAYVRVKEKSQPAKKTAALYDGHYAKYAALYPALKGWFGGN